MQNKVFSVIPYYGGKAKMNSLIVDLLDYQNTDIYIEPFGGGARTLLNKPRHSYEVMNDLSTGIQALFTTLTDRTATRQLMNFLYETEYSKKWFEWAVAYRNEIEDNAVGEIKRQMIDYISQIEDRYNLDLWGEFHKSPHDIHVERTLRKLGISQEERKKAVTLVNKYLSIKSHENLSDVTVADALNKRGYDKIHHAAATFIVYQMSRDSMGKYFTAYRFKSENAYYNTVDRLLEANDRLSGVQIYAKDAMEFFDDGEDTVLNDKRVMLYCDPTYLSEEDVDTYIKLKEDYNPGAVYKNYWTYTEHEEFLKKIQYAECKILLSNYRDRTHLYDNYLNNSTGWRSIEYETVTTVGVGAKKRTEVLWLNY
ncbi:site-specific DNA-adenine methylase [Anaerotaenia torta]|uniref:DNA adenine methylase n=1 Tax=Anaerotaenia torta TaxID=433293 RepID=UPI003D1E12AB